MMCEISNLCLDRQGHIIPITATLLVGMVVRNVGP